MSQLLELCVQNSLEEVTRSLDEVNGFLGACRLPPRIVYDVNLVLEEVLTNIVKYAHRDGGSHAIDMCIGLSENAITIVCSDDGHPFDPLSVPPPDFSLSMIEREPGGLGIHLVRKTVDSIVYARSEGKNVLTMTVRLKPDAPLDD